MRFLFLRGEMSLPKLRVGNKFASTPIIQGGMGIGLSGYKLAGTVAKEGGVGVLSSAALDRQVSARLGKKLRTREATAEEVQAARRIAGENSLIGMNIMVAVLKDYENSVLGSMDGGVDLIISGAGLPMRLPEIASQHPRFDEVALAPIVSSGRALQLILRRWERVPRLPDLIVVEGPLAGGHLGWKSRTEILDPKHKLELLIPEVLAVLKKKNLNIPVIAAGGVYTHSDILKYLDLGCAGVQMGTRFLATKESNASKEYKEELIKCRKEDIFLAEKPGSPCGLPFRVLKQSPFYQQALQRTRAPKCDKGYLLNKGYCPSKYENEKTFCICNGLLSSIHLNGPEERQLYTVGANGYRINKILSVKELMDELKSNSSFQSTSSTYLPNEERTLR